MFSYIANWFHRNDSNDFESVLSALALDIQKRQTRLAEMRLRERRATLLTTLYLLAAYGLYVAVWYAEILPAMQGARTGTDGSVRRRGGGGAERMVKALPVVLGPIVILFTRRIVQWWYTRVADTEEKALKALLHKQRITIEDIKKKTNYYATRNLIDRYDAGTGPGTPQRALSAKGNGNVPQTPVQKPNAARKSMGPQIMQGTPVPLPGALEHHLTPQKPTPLPTPRKQWYDKVADALLGDEDAAPPAASRYALICEKCFAHNGLVKESMWEDTQYTCPKCGHFNPSARSRKSPVSSAFPISPTSVSQAASPQQPMSAVGSPPQPMSASLPMDAPSSRDPMQMSPQQVQAPGPLRQRLQGPLKEEERAMDIDS